MKFVEAEKQPIADAGGWQSIRQSRFQLFTHHELPYKKKANDKFLHFVQHISDQKLTTKNQFREKKNFTYVGSIKKTSETT